MNRAQDVRFSPSSLRVARSDVLRPTSLRWFAGVYFLILGTSLLLLPQSSLLLWLNTVWLRGACTVASGLVLLWATVLPQPRRTALVLHMLAAAPHIASGFEYARLDSWTTAALLWLLALGVLLAPVLPAGEHAERAGPDMLALVLGIAQMAQGLDLVLRPGAAIMVPAALGLPATLVGILFVGAGLTVTVVQFLPGLPAPAAWAAHLLSGALILMLWIAQSLFRDPIYWALGAAVVVRGMALAVLPWWGRRVERYDPNVLQARLALALVSAAIIPLLIVLALLLSVFEQRRVERGLAQQQRLAQVVALMLAELPEETATAAFDAQLARIPVEAGVVIGLVGATGEPLATSDLAQAQRLPDAPLLWAQGAALPGTSPIAVVVPGPADAHLVGAAQIAGRPWRIVTIMPESALVADLTALRQLAFALVVLAGLGAGFGGSWLAGQLTRPIRALIRDVTRIAEGEHGAMLPRDGPAELAQLSLSVERMAAALDARLEERDQLVRQLQRQNRELSDHEEAREESIRALSHDLRNPLTALSGNAQRLVRLLQGLEKEGRIAQTILTLSQRLNTMIADLADALRVDAGVVEMSRAAVHVPALVAELRSQLGDPTQAARVQIIAPPQVPAVYADGLQVERVLTNLVSNALKYSPADSPVVVEIRQSASELVVAITDRGIGMTEAEQAQLFQRYYRAARAQGLASGLGLGLYVTRALVEAHGGRIWVESRPEVGSTVSFTLPLIMPPTGDHE